MVMNSADFAFLALLGSVTALTSASAFRDIKKRMISLEERIMFLEARAESRDADIQENKKVLYLNNY